MSSLSAWSLCLDRSLSDIRQQFLLGGTVPAPRGAFACSGLTALWLQTKQEALGPASLCLLGGQVFGAGAQDNLDWITWATHIDTVALSFDVPFPSPGPKFPLEVTGPQDSLTARKAGISLHN